MPDVDTDKPASSPTRAAPRAASEYTPPTPPGRLQRAASATRRWARDTFSREQLVAAVKQLMWVAPLTILIWVYAEREQRTTEPDVRFGVEAFSNNPKVFVRLLEPADGAASADLTGPRAQLEKLRRELGAGMSAVRFEVPADRKDGEHQFPLNFVLSRDSRFGGITVSNAMPRNINVLVDTLVEETVPLRLREEDQKLFEQVVFAPTAVKVRIPEGVLDDIRAASPGRQLVAYPDLSAVTDRTPGRQLNLSGVPVTLHNAPPAAENGITILPPTVSVSLTVRRADQDVTIPRLALQEMGVTTLRNNWDVTKEQSLFNVVLVGPAETIERIRKDLKNVDQYVEAYVKLEPGDVGAGERQKEIFFRLPPGVKVTSVFDKPVTEDQPPTTDVTVTSRGDGQ